MPLTIFPTRQRLLEAINRLFGTSDNCGVVIHGMMTFGQFESRLQSEILGQRKAIPPLGKSLLAAKVINRHYKNGRRGAFSEALKFRGFGTALVSFFDELSAGLIGPEELKKIRGYAQAKEVEILTLYEAYHQELEKHGYLDEGAVRKTLVEALENPATFNNSPTLARFDTIRLVDIYQFTPYRFELFRRIAKVKPVVIVAPTPDERRRAFGYLVTNLEKFESLADQAGKLEIEFQEPDEGPIAAISSRLFDLSTIAPKPFPELENKIEVLKCASRYREIEEVGSSIATLRDEMGLEWKEFCLIFRDINPYGPIIEDVFHRYSIPFHFKKGIKLSHNPFIKSILALFETIDSGFSRDNVIRILSSPYFSRFKGINIDDAQRLFLDAGVIDGPISYWRRKISKKTATLKKSEQRKMRKIIKETLSLIELLEKLGGQLRPNGFLDALRKVIRYLRPDPEPYGEGARVETIRYRDHHAYFQFKEIMSDLGSSIETLKMASSPLGFEKVKNLLLSYIDLQEAPEPHVADRNIVSVLNAHDAIGLSFPVVYICGMHEKEFPRYLETSSFLHETEKKKFNAIHAKEVLGKNPLLVKGRTVFDTAQDKWREESLLFYQAVRSAKQRLTLTFSAQELDGRRLARSQFIDDTLEAIAPGMSSSEMEERIKETAYLAMQKEPDSLTDPEERITRLIKDIFRPAEECDDGDLEERISKNVRGSAQKRRFCRLVDLTAIERTRDEYFFENDFTVRANLINRHNGLLSYETKKLNNVLVDTGYGRYAPTDLEKYGQCPFRYFAGKLLGLEALEEPLMELDARRRGTLLHKALELFYEKLIKADKVKLQGTSEEEKTLENAAVEAFAECERQGGQGDPLLWKIEKEKILSELSLWLRLETADQSRNGFIPIAVEPKFDIKKKDKKAFPPLIIDIKGDGKRYLIGRIDRIDINRETKSVRVVDYKSGKSPGKYKKMIKRQSMGDFSFQPPIYTILAKDYVKREKLLDEVTHAYGGYRLIRANRQSEAYIITDSGKDAQQPVDDGVFLDPASDAETSFVNIAAGVINKIESGVFPVAPKDCDYCDFAGLCRYIPAISEEKKDNE